MAIKLNVSFVFLLLLINGMILSCSSSSNSTCDLNSCRHGCCLNGECKTYDQQGAKVCGKRGAQCAECVSGQCLEGVCDSTGTECPLDCTGCCANSMCLTLTQQTNKLCGIDGVPCESCIPYGGMCIKGECRTCSPNCDGKCPGADDGCNSKCTSENSRCTGCCSKEGECLEGVSADACGIGGAACKDCSIEPTNKSCCKGRCGTNCTANCQGKCQGANNGVGGTCDQNDCHGCCIKDTKGAIICMVGTNDNNCGIEGKDCVDCFKQGLKCKGGSCKCTPNCKEGRGKCKGEGDGCNGVCPENTCDGCCAVIKEKPYCAYGTYTAMCGKEGLQCEDCRPNGTCDPAQGKCVSSCTCEGKCLGADNGCGVTCTENKCTGCCLDKVCMLGTEKDGCGKPGGICKPCKPNEVCDKSKGECILPCNASTCQGCCDTAGKCVLFAFTKEQCGTGGQSCKPCSGDKPYCYCGTCSAKACAGCCDALYLCNFGDEDTLCGTDGALCTDCTLEDWTCFQQVCGP